ncbi:hypothetical protein MPH_12216 [Macrophomina phaseolina MS6]|uniref:Protein SQS1 n=1 Tax=Macrophomina phaseolina (strain MS6) TaxID=1126212 RepID=K2RCU6_MACPH|nr:hypothetical protein MPH_12216 [Macrophomina phaseolina MS6]
MWAADVKLRHKAISFVSAGNLAGTMPDEPSSEEYPVHQPSTYESNIDESLSNQHETLEEVIARSGDAMAQMHLEPTAEASSSPPLAALFFEDTTGSSALPATSMPPPVVRNVSPTPSDSSEEIVLFRGRNNVRTVTDSVHLAGINIRADNQSASTFPAKSGTQGTADVPIPVGNKWTNDASTRHSNRCSNVSPEPDDDAMADYIENIQTQEYDDAGELQSQALYETSTLTQRVLGLSDGDGWDDNAHQPSGKNSNNGNPHKDDWASPQLEIFDNISTSSEMLGSINRILRKRVRSSGTQYLVVFENSSEDEARWIPVSRITEDHELALIAAFEETVANVRFGNEGGDSESWSDASEEDEDDEDIEEDENGDELDSEDEEDLLQRKIERMSDEKIARLLAKQEQLGMASAELLLFDGEDDDLEFDGLDDEFQDFAPQRTRGKKQKSKTTRGRDSFPSASVMADVLEQDPYNGFDIMDFERPSLKKKKKGKAADLPFELSDDELVAQLVNSWENDRSKKRVKKQERAELRSQGLLGKKNKFKPDMNARYNEGMSFVQIREEIKVFLNSPAQSRPFPPMDKRDRAALHQVAAALGLTSRSVGSGKSRFTTLIKTSRTRDFDEIAFSKITSRYQNRFLQRMDKRSGGKKGAFGGSGGGKYSGVSYRDGDVVGGSAPEIGSDNKGRAMLEKMGWSSGTALGAMNNKGILQPVTHVVKTTKTGLG